MSRGGGILAAGAAGAVIAPLLALGLKLPLWLALLVAVLVFGGVWLVLQPRGSLNMPDEALLDARAATARELTTDARGAVARLRTAASGTKDTEMARAIRHLADVGAGVLDEVKKDPDRAMQVRRLLAFYLPNAASLAEGWRTLEARAAPSPERVAQTRATLEALGQAFAHYADDVATPELESLDLDLKVLRDALKSDLEIKT